MKRILVSLLIGGLFFSLVSTKTTFAQDEGKPFRFAVKTNPLAALGGPFYVVGIVPVTGEYKLVLEAKTFSKQSLQVTTSYVGPSAILNLEQISDSLAAISVDGYRFQGMYKFFLTSTDKNMEGFYLAPHFSYAKARIADKNNKDDKVTGTKTNFNGVLGYQIITDGGFALDIYTGFGIKSVKWTFNTSNSDFGDLSDKSGINVTLGLSFGYAF